MAEIYPFNALRYAARLRPDLAKLLTPPYDVIDPAIQRELLARHPNNFVRVDFGPEEPGDGAAANKYTRAAETMAAWKREGVLAPDAAPAFYVYEQEFDLPGRGRRRRRGFFAAVKLEGFDEEGGIRAHERTFEGPKADRLQLTRATGCNLSPIFSVFDDPSRAADEALGAAIAGAAPDTAEIDGIIHRLWAVSDAGAVKKAADALRGQRLYIADGHHRYETALNFRAERRKQTGRTGGGEPFDSTLMFLANTRQEGLEILPTHRTIPRGARLPDLRPVLAGLAEEFAIEEIAVRGGAEAAAQLLEPRLAAAGAGGAPAFVILYGEGPAYLLRLEPSANPETLIGDPSIDPAVKRLDVSILHHAILPRFGVARDAGHDDLGYVKDFGEVVRQVRSGEASAGFLMNATRMSQVIEVAGLGLRMPQKSTYFYPKIVTGMVIRDMNGA